MADPRLGPDELDRLEDALEGLEFLEDLGVLAEPSDAVVRRLADFRLILQASREAMPLEEVPAGLLEGVLAEARMSSADMRTPSERPEQPSFWSRLRKAWLIPGLAVAGSAALVLLLLQPTLRSSEPTAAETTPLAMNEPPAPAAPEPAAAAALEGRRAAAEEVPEAPADDAAAPPPAPPAAGAPETKTEANFAESAKSDDADAKAEPEPEPAREAEDLGTDGWNAIEEGDKARKGGDCFSARNHYAKALDDGNDSVRARAYVGLGLCKREEGNDAAATTYFEQARELDQDALDFAGTQAKSKAPPKPSRARKKASGSKQNPIDVDEQRNAFE